MNEGSAQVMYGFVPHPAIGFMMGGRRMVVTAMTPIDYNGVVGRREVWDPLEGTGTNRKEDKNHRKAIAAYIEENPNYVLNSLLVYIGEQDGKFIPDRGDLGAIPVQPGTLYVRPGAKFKVGDGGHRTDAYQDVIEAHQPLKDEVYERLAASGQPIVVVLDDDNIRRAQDFTDLQRNAKPLNASIGQSMDRRQALNRILIEDVIKRPGIAVFEQGKRIEFLTDTPGKLSAKIMSYKTLRYASGTLLAGTGSRDVKGWEAAVDLKIAEDQRAAVVKLADFWGAFGNLPEVAKALTREKGVALLRDNTWLASANLLYAVAAAVNEAVVAGASLAVETAVRALGTFDFTRGPESPLVGTLVDKDTGKAVAGRGAWEGAAKVLFNHISAAAK